MQAQAREGVAVWCVKVMNVMSVAWIRAQGLVAWMVPVAQMALLVVRVKKTQMAVVMVTEAQIKYF